MNRLVLNNITKRYKDTLALDAVTLTLEEGIHALIGPNGAGKSTLINLITTLLSPTCGTISYNNKDITTLKNHYRQLIGYMPQHQQGYEQFSGYQFLHYMAVLKAMDKETAHQQIEQYIDALSLREAIHQKVKTYSGGMRQRLMFAQAILGDPTILILDEPTAGLDPSQRIRMRNLISQIAQGKIILIATHVMQDIESIASHIVMMKQGRLLFEGSVTALLAPLQGKVFECRIPMEQLTKVQQRYHVSHIAKLEHEYLLRCIGKDYKEEHLLNAMMEDAYLYYMEML